MFFLRGHISLHMVVVPYFIFIVKTFNIYNAASAHLFSKWNFNYLKALLFLSIQFDPSSLFYIPSHFFVESIDSITITVAVLVLTFAINI